MFDYIFSKLRVKGNSGRYKRSLKEGARYVPLVWSEHCIECSAPKCYGTCPRYERRSDGHCVRVEGGISPVLSADGALQTAVHFRSWAKIEAQLKAQALPAKKYGRLNGFVTRCGYALKWMSGLLGRSKAARFVCNGWFSVRQKLINRSLQGQPVERALVFVGRVFNEEDAGRLLVDIKTNDKLLFREAVEVPRGETDFAVNIPPYGDDAELCFINIHPADAEWKWRLVFQDLEVRPRDPQEGKKVKCVIWDLDNTLWKGVLIEDKTVEPNARLVEIIKELDARGIVNSIASKNDAAQAEEQLQKLGLSEYFVFKKINWNPKSANVGQTIRQMNINADTVVFVDDNPFERHEVSLQQPRVTCLDPSEVEAFVKGKRCDVPVTADSKRRRQTYVMLEQLKQEEEQWTGDIDDFLKSCRIRLDIAAPDDSNIMRCYELLQRTNQLNSSGRRLSLDEVKAIVASGDHDSYVLHSSDKFGDYGIVGFLIVDRTGEPRVSDFVISCRVANKKIEPTLINYLAGKYGGLLRFDYKKTARNGPMFQIISDLKMEKIGEAGDVETYLHRFDNDYAKIVDLTEK